MKYKAQCLKCKTAFEFSTLEGLECLVCSEGESEIVVLIPAEQLLFSQSVHYVTFQLDAAPRERRRVLTNRRRDDLHFDPETLQLQPKGSQRDFQGICLSPNIPTDPELADQQRPPTKPSEELEAIREQRERDRS